MIACREVFEPPMLSGGSSAAGQADERIEIVEETARIETLERVTGTVRVHLSTDSVEEMLRQDLRKRTVRVERVPAGRPVEALVEPRVENGVTILSIVEERLVVEKRLFLVEEIHIHHETTSENVEIPVSLRKQRVVVERSAGETTPIPSTRNQAMSSLATTPTSSRQMVTAFFDDRDDAESAVERIVDGGVARSDIKMVEGADPSATTTTTTASDADTSRERGFFESLGDFFMPDEDKHVYAEGLSRGGYLVSVPTTETNRDAILDILDDEGTVDMDERETSWRSEGWSGQAAGYDAATTGTSAVLGAGASDGLVSRDDVEARPVGAMSDRSVATGAVSGGALAEHDGTIQVVEENLRVGKRDVAGGRVRVRSYVVEDAVSEDVSLHSERVDIQRRSVDRPVASFDAAFKDQTIELEETTQEAVISKEARVKEEIDLRRVASDRVETVSDTVRRTEVEIDDARRGASASDAKGSDRSAHGAGTLGLPTGRTDKTI